MSSYSGGVVQPSGKIYFGPIFKFDSLLEEIVYSILIVAVIFLLCCLCAACCGSKEDEEIQEEDNTNLNSITVK